MAKPVATLTGSDMVDLKFSTWEKGGEEKKHVYDPWHPLMMASLLAPTWYYGHAAASIGDFPAIVSLSLSILLRQTVAVSVYVDV